MTQGTDVELEIGIGATLRLLGNDRMRVVLDDLILESDQEKTLVKIRGLFTHLDFDAYNLQDIPLTKDELAALGETILCRLLALRENKDQWFSIAQKSPIRRYGELK